MKNFYHIRYRFYKPDQKEHKIFAISDVHFSEKIEGGDVLFTYKLESGPSVSTNAIALLRKNGFPEEVILKSEKLCASLDSKGV